MANNTDKLVQDLDYWIPETGQNRKLLDVIGQEFDDIESLIDSVENATHIQTAETLPQLRNLAAAEDIAPRDGESLEAFRRRALVQTKLTTNEGTIPEALNITKQLFHTDIEKITYKDPEESMVVTFEVPSSVVNDAPISAAKAADIISKSLMGGARLNILVPGSHTYISPTAYNNSNFDHDQAYVGLDENGEPNYGSGGTYGDVST